MITTLSWRRGNAPSVDEDGQVAVQPLLAVDGGSTMVLHLGEGATTEPVTRSAGQLAVIVDGAGRVEIGDEAADLETGDAVRLPAGVPHRLSTLDGLSAVVVSYPETPRSWRVVRSLEDGGRWVAGVFSETDRARACRDELREGLDADSIALE